MKCKLLTLFLCCVIYSSSPLPALGDLGVALPRFDPQTPPFGLKTYRDLGLTVDETIIARRWNPEAPGLSRLQQPIAENGLAYPLYEEGNQFRVLVRMIHPDNATETEGLQSLWSTYSKDGGESWSEPRFMASLVEPSERIRKLEVRRASGRALSFTLHLENSPAVEFRLKENDLRRLATLPDLDRAEPGRFVLSSVPVEEVNQERLADSLCIHRNLFYTLSSPPQGYQFSSELGILLPKAMDGRVLHRAQSKVGTLYETRAVVTPRGDYLVMIPDGKHANAPQEDANVLLAYRSSDQGKTWTGPFEPFPEKSKHHGILPLIPKGSDRIYLFETQRGSLSRPAKNDRAFGFRYSDNDGHHWSSVKLIQDQDNRLFGGTGVIQMTETTAGTWMVGFHHSRMLRGELQDDQRHWTKIEPKKPANPPGSLYFLDELRVVGLKGPNVVAMARTCAGEIWQRRSSDDGRTWGEPTPTPLTHPDAPPMVFQLSDQKTLIALHHNRAVMRSVHEPIHSKWLQMPTPTREEIELRNRYRHSAQDWVSRAEVWFSLSKDGGQSWSQPRFLFANALAETLPDANSNYQCSYIDLFTDKGKIHLIVPHRWRRILHLTINESDLTTLSTSTDLAK
ncbi:Exo-alpha-sialidase [Planctomycetales bacterium 10988]|nr:Exo-alpha-sialidase [Planctomycetales bacterium 10988]